MSNKFHSLQVANLTQETADATSITFEIPSDLKELFSYKQGQYVTIKATINGEEIRRAYSMSSSPVSDLQPKITIKKVENGRMSNFLCTDVKQGDTLEVMPPMGTFLTAMNAENTKKYILLGAGSGITPLMSILKTVLEIEPNSEVLLYYGNRNWESVIFKSELENLVEKYSNRLSVTHILSRENTASDTFLSGRIDEEKLTSFISENKGENYEYFVCGPSEMLQTAEKVLENNNVSKSQIHIEYFGTSSNAETEETTNSETEKSCKLTIILDDQEYEMELKAGQKVLDAAIEADIDPPFSCQTGVCTTCKAYVEKGNTKMLENLALDEDEVANGYTLTCQCVATDGEDIVISFE